MNVIELLLFLVLSIALLLFAQLLSRWLGTVEWFLGVAPLGVGWALFLFGTFRGMVVQTRHSWTQLPQCRRGKCQTRDYRLMDSPPNRTVIRCRCGELYRYAEDRFAEILPDGSLRPYMVRDALGNWKADPMTSQELNRSA